MLLSAPPAKAKTSPYNMEKSNAESTITIERIDARLRVRSRARGVSEADRHENLRGLAHAHAAGLSESPNPDENDKGRQRELQFIDGQDPNHDPIIQDRVLEGQVPPMDPVIQEYVVPKEIGSTEDAVFFGDCGR